MYPKLSLHKDGWYKVKDYVVNQVNRRTKVTFKKTLSEEETVIATTRESPYTFYHPLFFNKGYIKWEETDATDIVN